MGNVAFDFMNMYLLVHLKSSAKPSIYKTINYGLPTQFWEGNVSSRVCPPVSHSVHRDHGALHLTVQGLRPPPHWPHPLKQTPHCTGTLIPALC